jgi:alginate O-acetyltransferase complex protein AlgI
VTFVIVCFAWVFFRAKDLAGALAYCRSMLGFGPRQDGMDLMTGLTTQPYFLASMALAAVVVWACPQTWDFTRRIGWLKAAYVFLVLLVSLAVMETQSFNPFIYFIF